MSRWRDKQEETYVKKQRGMCVFMINRLRQTQVVVGGGRSLVADKRMRECRTRKWYYKKNEDSVCRLSRLVQ